MCAGQKKKGPLTRIGLLECLGGTVHRGFRRRIGVRRIKDRYVTKIKGKEEKKHEARRSTMEEWGAKRVLTLIKRCRAKPG